MEVWGLIGFLFIAFALTSMVLGVIAFVQTRELKQEIRSLKLQMGPQPVGPRETESSVTVSSPDPVPPAKPAKKPPELTLDLDLDPVTPVQPMPAPEALASENGAKPTWLDALLESAKTHWMVWLGGACVGLAGIFLARYAVEKGVLGPVARVTAGIITGLVLHILALWLRNKRGAHPSFAALAGGASITLFAVLLAALHWYQMFSVPVVFVLLALVAIATLWLALLHGPLLAAIGMLGAYSVPALVSSGGGAIHVALIYSLVILVMVLALYRRVRRDWLWWGAIAGVGFWWLISQDYNAVDGWRGYYLAGIALASVFIGAKNWRDAAAGYWPKPFWSRDKLALTLCGLLLAALFNNFIDGWYNQFFNAMAVPVLVLALCGFRRDWGLLTPLAIVSVWLPLLISHGYWQDEQWQLGPLSEPLMSDLQRFLLMSLLVFLALAVFGLRQFRDCHWRAATASLAPLAALCVGYWLTATAMPYWQWALLGFSLACVYLGAAPGRLKSMRVLALWLFIAGHFGAGVAAAMLLAEGGLTLAFAAMLVSVAWVIQRFEAPELAWVFKTLVLIVTVRLSANPFVVFYQAAPEWLLLSFALATAACFAGARLLAAMPSLSRWGEIATLHLAMLTTWLLARYCLNAGDPFANHYSAEECVVNLWLFGAMACLYEYKARASTALAGWYRAYSRIQFALATLHYVIVVLAALNSAPWLVDAIAPRPLVNLLLPAMVAPAVLMMLAHKLAVAPMTRWSGLAVMGTVFLLVNFEIRHLWQGSISLLPATGNGELYSYSIVWLLIAMGLMLGIIWHQRLLLYRVGMALLVLVIGKIFLWDMAGLEGLWRVASFMGLGLALLALGYLHQRLSTYGQDRKNA